MGAGVRDAFPPPMCCVVVFIHLRMETPLCGRSGGHTGTAPTVLFGWIAGGRSISLVLSKKVCKLNIILIFALSNKKQQEYGTYTRTNFGNYFELHK